LERRGRRLGLVALALCAMLSACAARVESSRPTPMGLAADLQCCGWKATGAGATVSSTDIRVARGALDALGDHLCHFEVAVSEGLMRRDAFGRAPIVGHVVLGEKLTILDFIDRRLRVLGRLVFDGGSWRKVRGQHGTVGWLPAAEVREVRGPCEVDDVAPSRLNE
jgi:hypothetical protein